MFLLFAIRFFFFNLLDFLFPSFIFLIHAFIIEIKILRVIYYIFERKAIFIMIDLFFFIKYMNVFILFIIILYLIIKSDMIVTINIIFEYIYFNRVF